jgi:hypothetical protein
MAAALRLSVSLRKPIFDAQASESRLLTSFTTIFALTLHTTLSNLRGSFDMKGSVQITGLKLSFKDKEQVVRSHHAVLARDWRRPAQIRPIASGPPSTDHYAKKCGFSAASRVVDMVLR